MLNLKSIFTEGFPATNGTKSIPSLCGHKNSRNPVLVWYEAGEFCHYLCKECFEDGIYYAQEVEHDTG